jgi:hypothetical protein
VAREVSRASNLAGLKTNSSEFQRQFQQDPVAALKAKGLVVSAEEGRRLNQKIEELRNRPRPQGDAAADVEVTVGVKVKF